MITESVKTSKKVKNWDYFFVEKDVKYMEY